MGRRRSSPGIEPTKARQFADLIGPFLLRRRKSDPGIAPELPAKTETDHLLGLTREQVVLYESFVRDTMERIERADEETRRGLVLKLLTGLKQICNHPAHFLKQSGGRLAGRSEKLDLLDELLGTVLAEDGAVLVFTQYVAMARLLEDHLTRAGVPHQFLHGGTPVRRARGDGGALPGRPSGSVPVFLLSLKAGGTGLNLTRADHVIHFDRWWNPAVEDQATDRAYRIGQTRPVQVHRMVTQGTIEERVAELLAPQARAGRRGARRAARPRSPSSSNDELRDLVTLRQDAVTARRDRPRSPSPAHPAAPRRRAGRHLVGPGLGARGRGGGVRRGRPARGPRAVPQRARSAGSPSTTARFVAAGRGRATACGRSAARVPVLDDRPARRFVEVVGGRVRPGRRAAGRRAAPPRWSSTPRRPASSCCRTAASWARPARAPSWVDPCVHALAVLLQLAWLVDGDPFVLLQLRGLSPDDLQAELAATSPRGARGRVRRPGRCAGRRRSRRPGPRTGRRPDGGDRAPAVSQLPMAYRIASDMAYAVPSGPTTVMVYACPRGLLSRIDSASCPVSRSQR